MLSSHQMGSGKFRAQLWFQKTDRVGVVYFAERVATYTIIISVTQALLLYSNKITSIDDGSFDSLTALTSLALYDNRLVDLPTNVFHSLGALQVGPNVFLKILH